MREGSIVKWEELEELKARGAVGDLNLRYFDSSGKAIASDLDDRVVGLSLEDFRQDPPRRRALPAARQSLMQFAARWRESSWTS